MTKRILTVLLCLLFSVLAIPVFANTTYVIEKDKTMSFENIDIVDQKIDGLNSYYDYIIYYKDGSVKEYNCNQINGSITVPAEGKAVITSTERDISSVIVDEFFIVDFSNNPVMKKVEIKAYETYLCKNTSNVNYPLLLRSNDVIKSEYVLYDVNGDIEKYNLYCSESELEIPPGYTAKITLTSNANVTINGLYDKYDFKFCSEPATKTAVIVPGETYSYTNKSNISCYLYSDAFGYSYNYVLYDANNNIVAYKMSGDNKLEIPVNHTVKITSVASSTLTFKGIYDNFDLKACPEPAMKTAVIAPGETYSYTNKSNISCYLYSNAFSYSYNYVLYDTNDEVAEYKMHCGNTKLEVPAGYTVKLTSIGYSNLFINGLYEIFDLNYCFEPAMKTVSLSPGETYSYKNISNLPYNLLSNGYFYDYILYDQNGSVVESQNNRHNEQLEIPAGHTAEITSVGVENLTTNVIYNKFEISNVTRKNTHYKIYNIDKSDTTVKLKATCSYDYSVYDAENKLFSYDINSTTNLKIPYKGYALVSINSLTSYPFIENSSVKIEPHDAPVYKTVYFEAGDTYKFTNISSKEIYILRNENYLDYVTHKADGSIENYSVNSIDSKITVPIGGNVIITSHENIQLKALSDYFNIEKQPDSVFVREFIKLGETKQFINNSVQSINVILTCGHAYDYVIYKANGNTDSSSVDTNSGDGKIIVPAGSKCVITPRVSNTTVLALREAFTSITSRSYPVMKRFYLNFKDTITINNSSSSNRTLYSNDSHIITYIIYDKNGTPIEEKERAWVRDLVIPAEGKAKITELYSKRVLAGLYEDFSGKDFFIKLSSISLSSTEMNLVKGKQAVIKASILPSDASNPNITWTTSDESVVTIAKTGKIVAKNTGTAIVTATTEDGKLTASCIINVYESDAEIPVKQPITIILTINSNIANIAGNNLVNDVSPILENSRTMLPARFVAENLGATVSWIDAEQKVVIKNDTTTIEIVIGSSTAYVNGEAKALDTPAFLRNSRTYTPVRFICESLGADVQWKEATQQVIITK